MRILERKRRAVLVRNGNLMKLEGQITFHLLAGESVISVHTGHI